VNEVIESGSFVLVDIKHGLALFFGLESEMQQRRESIIDRCKSYRENVDSLLVVLSKSQIGDMEYEYMVAKRRVPRRMMMRLQSKEVAQ